MPAALPDIPQTALDWHRAGRGAVLATVIETWGSAPRPVGSQLVIDGAGAMEGSVSGGCVEAAVITEAVEALGAGARRLLTYGVSDDNAFAVGLACGGTIRILVEPVGAVLSAALLAELVAARSARQPVALIAPLGAGEHRLEGAAGHEERFRRDRSGVDESGEAFIAVHNPPLRMVVTGAVHIAQALLPMARACGFATYLIDPRPAFAAAARFPGQQVSEDWPDEAMAALGIDARTAVITLTHDPKIDDPAIITALGSDCFYLGCLGSGRTHAKRVARLSEAGVSADQLTRLRAPVGLDLGAMGAAEIAVSILGQVIAVLRGKG